MIGFHKSIFYVGETNEYVEYGEECVLWYSYGARTGVEEIEVTTYSFELLISLSSNTLSSRVNGKMFGYDELDDFVFEEEWDEIQRDHRLEQLLIELGI